MSFVCPFVRMPFGLTNAPSVFQRLMDCVLSECSDFAKVYNDDILIVSWCWEEHLDHVRCVLRTLREAGLTCKRKKCSFWRRTLEFLGHLVGHSMISVPAARLAAIRNHPLRKTRRQLRAFLGLVGYYRRFIGGFHKWPSILTPHTSGELRWSGPMLEAFHMLCGALSSSVSLCVRCTYDSFVLGCDACNTGVRVVLSVEREGVCLPVAFFSRQLQGAQTRYSAQELEGLAIYESIRHFAYFLYGRRFLLFTDHRGLVNLMCNKQMNRHLYGWALKLSDYDFEIVYSPGCLNTVPDALSRCHGEREENLLPRGGVVGSQSKEAHIQEG